MDLKKVPFTPSLKLTQLRKHTPRVPMKISTLALALAFVTYTCAHSQSATVSAPSTQWMALQGNFDFLDDLQPGHPDSNIVGQGTDYGLFVTHNDNGSASLTDGTLGFRLRLDGPGGTTKDTKYARAAYLGIDADFNDTIDVVIGVNFSGSKNELGIYAVGTGANNSPSSLSIESTPIKTYTINPANYDYRPVNYLTDGGTTNDLNPGKKGEPDYYLSVLVDFADIVSYLAGKGIKVTDKSPLRYVAATSTQGNKLNEDIAGVQGNENSGSTWSQLGVFTQTVTANGNLVVVPEPGSALLVLLGALLPLLRRVRSAA